MKAPRFLYSVGLSSCCNSKALLVRSRAGGFVSRNCLKCGKESAYVRQNQLPDLECEFCGTNLATTKLDEENYFYKCGKCGRSWKLADYLPHWSEVSSYCGLAAPGDPGYSR
jgi:hypothetical protein